MVMMWDKNRRQQPKMEAAEEWALQNTESLYLDAQYQEASDIRLVDISAEGIGIRTTEALPKDRIISFDLCFSTSFHRVIARVLWNKQIGEYWRNGLQILQMPEELMDEIGEYLEEDHENPMN